MLISCSSGAPELAPGICAHFNGCYISPPPLENTWCWRAGEAEAIQSCSEKAQISTTYFCPQRGEKTHGARDGDTGWLKNSFFFPKPPAPGRNKVPKPEPTKGKPRNRISSLPFSPRPTGSQDAPHVKSAGRGGQRCFQVVPSQRTFIPGWTFPWSGGTSLPKPLGQQNT